MVRLGNRAVHGLFALSGFLIALSYLRSNSAILADFCDGFKDNIVPNIVNGPIWTLTWEVVCYTLVVVLGVFGILNRSSFPPLWLGLIISFSVGFENISTAYTVLFSVISLALIIFPTLFQSFFNAIDDNLLFLWGPKIRVAQVIFYVFSMNEISLTPIPFFLLTMLLVIPFALLSWYLIEKPDLALKSLGKYIEQKAII